MAGEEILNKLKEIAKNLRAQQKGSDNKPFDDLLTNFELLLFEIEHPIHPFTLIKLRSTHEKDSDFLTYIDTLNNTYKTEIPVPSTSDISALKQLIEKQLNKPQTEVKRAPVTTPKETKFSGYIELSNNVILKIALANQLIHERKTENDVSDMELIEVLKTIKASITKEQILDFFRHNYLLAEKDDINLQRKIAPIIHKLREPKTSDILLLTNARQQIAFAFYLATVNVAIAPKNIASIRDNLAINFSPLATIEFQKHLVIISSMISQAVGEKIIPEVKPTKIPEEIAKTLKILKTNSTIIASNLLRSKGMTKLSMRHLPSCENQQQKIALAFAVALNSIDINKASLAQIRAEMEDRLNRVFDAEIQLRHAEKKQSDLEEVNRWLNVQLTLAKNMNLMTSMKFFAKSKEGLQFDPQQTLLLLRTLKTKTRELLADTPLAEATLDKFPAIEKDSRQKFVVIFYTALQNLPLNNISELKDVKTNLEKAFEAAYTSTVKTAPIVVDPPTVPGDSKRTGRRK